MPTKKHHEHAASAVDFWAGKTPCWEMTPCPKPIYTDCPAYRYRQYPCWEIEGTYCKWDRWGTLGQDTSVCLICEVYLKWGEGRPIELRLRGKGIKLLINP